MSKTITTNDAIDRATTGLKSLVGRKIVKVDGVITYGDQVIPYLELDDGRRAYILRDEEGNGPGHLDVVEPD